MRSGAQKRSPIRQGDIDIRSKAGGSTLSALAQASFDVLLSFRQNVIALSVLHASSCVLLRTSHRLVLPLPKRISAQWRWAMQGWNRQTWTARHPSLLVFEPSQLPESWGRRLHAVFLDEDWGRPASDPAGAGCESRLDGRTLTQ